MVGRSNGRVEAHREEQRRQREHQEDMAAIQQAFNQSGELDRGWMEEVLDVDELTAALPEETVRKIQATVNRQFILANLTDAQEHDRWWWLEALRYKLIAEHPRPQSTMQGARRAFFFDDEAEQLTALTDKKRNHIDQIIVSLQNMVTRSRGGFEREQQNSTIAVTESPDRGGDSDDGLLSGLGS